MDPLHHGCYDPVAAFSLELEGGGALGAYASKQFATQLCARPVQPHLHIVLGDAETFGGFLRAHLFDVAQHEYVAIRIRQRIDRVLQQPA